MADPAGSLDLGFLKLTGDPRSDIVPIRLTVGDETAELNPLQAVAVAKFIALCFNGWLNVERIGV